MKNRVQIGIYMPRALKCNLKAELDREGKQITSFVIEQAKKYLEKKHVRLPRERNKAG